MNADTHTHDIQSTTIQLAGQAITLIDTPGYEFHDAHHSKTQDDVLREITVFLNRTYSNRKLDGVVYVHRVSDRPQGGIPKENFRRFQRVCAMTNVVVAMWDDRGGDDAEDVFPRNLALFQDALDNGAQMPPYDGTAPAAKLILTRFLAESAEVVRLQRELEIQQRPVSWRTAAAGIASRLEMQEQSHRQDMEELRQRLQRDTASREAAHREEVERSLMSLQLKLAQMEAENRNLAAEVER
ncbi:hypothetical protein B0H21DRAFT_687542, partial [Amylocystis lapponica]